MQNDRSIRIRTEVGENAPQVINVALGQTYDTLEILSLKLRQENLYKLFSSDYGVIVGRVLASGNFGVPNAKVSVFIEVEGNESTFRKILYGYKTVSSKNEDGIRYNLLPDEAINACYQNVGTFPNKRYLLDNTDIIETFDKYWKYTTVTNAAGDYMLFGIPTGQQTVHVDIDLSDIGVLSQRPRDMMYQGFNINQFESPNKFKQSTDLTSLAQIKSQDKGVNVFPYWGDTTMDDGATIGITRCDIQIQYEFQPTCIFMGSIITDKASNAIGKNCGGSEKVGNMSELGTGEGSIEMIRKTFDGKTEEFQIKGNRLIDGDGVWCYQIPMNLDYVMTDEFGNTVPTDDPTKGIPTRTRVRFRISLDEAPDDRPAKKRARYLVPNNPRISSDYPEFTKKVTKVGNDAIDYEFGSATLDEDFRDLMWNNVYTVKNYIPRIQASKRARDRKNTAIKKVNYAGDNNPMPYNNLFVRLTLQYNIICIVIKTFITIVGTINSLVIGALAFIVDPYWTLSFKIFGKDATVRVPNPIGMLLTAAGLSIHCIPLNGRFCEAAENTVYFPGCPGNAEGKSFINATDNTVDWVQEQNANALYYQCMDDGGNEKKCKELSQEKYGKQKIYKNRDKVQLDEGSKASFDDAELYNCVEQQLIEENESATFNFANDWVNGVLYAPLWFRKIKPKKKFFFGLITRKAKDKYCSTDRNIKNRIKIHQSGSSYKKALKDESYKNEYGKEVIPYVTIPDPSNNYDKMKDCGEDCQNEVQTTDRLKHGIIKRKETLYSADAYYYAPIEYYSTKNINTTREDQYKDIEGEVKLLYATDIVLLGSLNDCDRFGLPQFFKVLEPTTYQLPPALLTKDEDQEMVWDATLGMFVEDDKNSSPSTTDTTGCDWGNANKIDQYYQVKTQWSGLTNYSKIVSTDGGLFYGVNCTSVDTVGKTNVNVLRLCELGVSLDETDEVENIEAEQKKTTNSDEIDAYDNLTADGFVSKDELYDLDARAAFATMNYNNLRTVFDEDRGIYVYDFRYLYPENFDGAMSAYMEWYMTKYSAGKRNQKETMVNFTTKTDEQVSYRFNYFLEKFNRDYYRFKMGKAPYFYEDIIDKEWHRFPRYENSYYFYFGLKFGKTAIEKFNSQFFSTCENTPDPAFTVKYDYQPNTWCSDMYPKAMNGYFAIETEGITTPYSVYLKNKYNESYEFEVINIESEKFVVKNKGCEKTFDKSEYYIDDTDSMCNGIYDLQIVDGAGNILDDTIKFTPPYLTYETEESVNFKTPFNLLMKTFEKATDAETYATIANVPLENGKRNIGGVICLSELVDFYELKDSWNNYKIRVTLLDKVYDSKTGDELHWDISILNKNVSEESGTNIHGHQYQEIDGKSYITVPIGNVIYSVEVIQMCNGIESQNRFKTELSIGEPKPLKLFINDVDSELFKLYEGDNETHFWDVNLPTLGPAWFNMRNSDYYDWEKDSNYQRLDNDEDRIAYQNEIFDKVESAFVMTKYGEKDLTLRVDGEDEYFPVIYNLYGQTEESTDQFDMDEYNNTLYKINGVTGNEVEGYTGVQTLPIAIPNVTPMDSFLWSSGSQITIYKVGPINAVWAQTNPILDHGVDDFIKESEKKKEYKCSAITATGVVIPSKKNDDSMIVLEPFKVIFIDKILTHEIISWAAPVNFPHYGNVTIAPNTYITENGFVMGKVVNGLATDLKNGYRKFNTQYLGNQDLALKYHYCDESSYPIYSYIDGGKIDRYDKVQVYENGDTQQYAFLPPLEQTLEINDGRGSGFTEECYGNMKVNLSSSSYDNGNSERLIVNCNIMNEDVNYYFYKIGDKTHPYDRTGDVTMNVWKGEDKKYMFSFQTKSDDLRAAAGVDNWNGSFVDDEGTIKPSTDTKEGYKAKYISTGIFENNKEDNGQYFVIAETANGSRAISPVYDFSDITIETVIYCEKDTTTSETDVDVSGKGSSEDGKTNVDVTASGKAEVVTDIYTFSIGFKVKKSNAPYYPLYYDYKMEGIAGGSSIGAATLDALKSEKETYLKVPLDTNKAKKIVDFDTMKVKKGTKVSDVINVEKIYVTDVTGLKHLCKVEPEINENLVTDK